MISESLLAELQEILERKIQRKFPKDEVLAIGNTLFKTFDFLAQKKFEQSNNIKMRINNERGIYTK
jgi:hypothetical protein